MRELRVEKDLGEGQRATRPQAVEDKSLSHKTEIDGWLQLIKPREATCACVLVEEEIKIYFYNHKLIVLNFE